MELEAGRCMKFAGIDMYAPAVGSGFVSNNVNVSVTINIPRMILPA
jgi:hypothetical protein